MSNRLEEKLGRECTDYDYDVQQELLERAHKEIRQLEAAVWAVAWAAPKHRVTYSPIHADPYDKSHVVTTWMNDADMTVTVQAEIALSPEAKVKE